MTTSEGTSARAAPLRDPGLTALPSDRLLDELLARLCTVMGAEVAQFLLVEGDSLRVLATAGVPVEKVADLRIPIGRGFAGTIAATRSPAVLADTSTLETFGPSWHEEGVRALVGVPLIVDDETVGVCVVGSRRDRSFGDGDITLLTAAAERAAWAVQNGLLLAAERRARDAAESVGERLRRLEEMSNELVSALSVDGVVRVLVERGLSLIGARGGSLWEPDFDGGTLRLRGVVGYPGEVVNRWQDIPLDADAPAADAVRSGEMIVLRSLQERDERYPSLRGGAGAGEAFVCAPLVVERRVVGVLGLGFESAEVLDDEGLAFLHASVAQCAAAMHRALVVQAQQRSLAATEESARRLAALQRLTAALADARDADQMARLIVAAVSELLAATTVNVAVLDERRAVMRSIGSTGLDAAVAEAFSEFPYDAAYPAADALLRREPIVLQDRSELLPRYPGVAAHVVADRAVVCLPLAIGERGLGTLSLTFADTPSLERDDMTFLVAIADQCAHALERARLLAIEFATQSRLELLAEAGRIFAAPLDVQLTSMQFCRLVVGRIGDAVSVHLREPNGAYVLAAAEHVDPEQARAQRATTSRLSRYVIDIYNQLLEENRPLLVSEIPRDVFESSITDKEIVDVLAQRPPQSNITLPLIAGGHALGVLNVTTVKDGHSPLTDDDVEQLTELAGRLALALDGARLLRQQTEIAHTLQRSLLPAALPRVPAAEVAVRYLPGAEGVDVGGDFYDVIPLPSGRIGLVVGDVMGRGVRAAAVMGQLRAAVRAYSLEGHPPAALLTRLDRLVSTLEEGLLVTALYAEWDPARNRVVCACAGHLPPLVHEPDAEPTYMRVEPGVPLGVGAQGYTEVELTLPPGALWLAFTDGLVEGPDLPVDEGMQQLTDALRGITSAVAACDAALAALRPVSATRRYDDDTALLALATYPTPAGEPTMPAADDALSIELAADASSPARARIFVADVLDRWGFASVVDAGMLLTSELVTNGVRHAGTAMRLSVRRVDDGTVRVAVTDHARDAGVRMRTADDEAEGGRGLFLVEQLASGWGSSSDDVGKTVWFELRR